MSGQPHIERLSLSELDCPIQTAALDWWTRSQGVADLDDPDYLALTPYLQLALDEDRQGAARFFYVGYQSMTAKLLGESFTAAVHAGQWWEDGGYAEAVSAAYDETSELKKPVLEEIEATIRLPATMHPEPSVVLHYDRLCLATVLANGQPTITVVTSERRTKPEQSNVVQLFDSSRTP